MFTVNNRNTRTKSVICSKFTIKTPERPYFNVSIVNYEQVNGGKRVLQYDGLGTKAWWVELSLGDQ